MNDKPGGGPFASPSYSASLLSWLIIALISGATDERDEMTEPTNPPLIPPPMPPPGLSLVPPAPESAASVTNIADFSAAMRKAGAKERWSSNVMDRGYTTIPTILLWGQARLELTADELNVLLQIISHWFYVGNDPHPSKARIAERMGKHPRTVQGYLTSLEKKGFLRRVERFRPSKGQDANGYDLSGLATKLESIAPEFKKVSEMNKNRRRKVEKPTG